MSIKSKLASLERHMGRAVGRGCLQCRGYPLATWRAYLTLAGIGPPVFDPAASLACISADGKRCRFCGLAAEILILRQTQEVASPLPVGN